MLLLLPHFYEFGTAYLFPHILSMDRIWWLDNRLTLTVQTYLVQLAQYEVSIIIIISFSPSTPGRISPSFFVTHMGDNAVIAMLGRGVGDSSEVYVCQDRAAALTLSDPFYGSHGQKLAAIVCLYFHHTWYTRLLVIFQDTWWCYGWMLEYL